MAQKLRIPEVEDREQTQQLKALRKGLERCQALVTQKINEPGFTLEEATTTQNDSFWGRGQDWELGAPRRRQIHQLQERKGQERTPRVAP